jgi:hypothetical protein
MTVTDYLLHVFYLIDRECEALNVPRMVRSRGPQPTLSDSEVITMFWRASSQGEVVRARRRRRRPARATVAAVREAGSGTARESASGEEEMLEGVRGLPVPSPKLESMVV